MLFDSYGNRMCPTYAIKAGRRYRYYTSAPLVRGTIGGKGVRVPAADIEELVTATIADHLADAQWAARIIGAAELFQVTQVISAAQRLSNSICEMSEQESQLLTSLQFIERIEVGQNSVTLSINRASLAEALEITEPDCIACIKDSEDPMAIVVPIRLQRCGKQVRLILGEVSNSTRSPDTNLVRLVRDGHRWFNDLLTGRAATIAAIAKRDRQQVSHVSRNISLAFLAPDITEMILTGRQPITLTPERLKAARPLPLEWDQQRTLLLD